MNTKEVILQVVKELFYHQGYNKTTIRQIQKEAKNLNIHYHYKNKKHLALAIYAQYIEKMQNEVLKNDALRKDAFLMNFVMYIIVYDHLIQDKNNRLYYLETLNECIEGYMQIIFDLQLGSMIAITDHYIKDQPSIDLLKYYSIIMFSCEKGIFASTFNGILKFAVDEIIEMHIKLVPQLFGVDEKTIEEGFKKGKEIADKMDLSHIRLLV
ncbi:MAG: TetR/AcrR family transcriptional regulator [Eubacteriales bacterium]